MAVQIGYTCPGASISLDVVSCPWNHHVVYYIQVPSVSTNVTLFLNLTLFFFFRASRSKLKYFRINLATGRIDARETAVKE